MQSWVRVNFRNEIIWQRTIAKSLMTRQLPTNHDVILSFQRGDQPTWNADALFTAYDPANLDEKTAGKYRHVDPDGRIYRLDSLINPDHNRPNLTYEFLGITRVWRWTKERMARAYDSGVVVQTGPGRVPQLKRYLDEQRGRPLGNVWTDIPPINSRAQERLGYPTQKPLALLDRIIKASSNPGDMVLDPFCGCATVLVAAETLGRRWAGIDLSPLAVKLVGERLHDHHGVFGQIVARTDVPRRTDLGELPNYRTHRHTLYGRQEGVCNGCLVHFPFRNLTVDHIVPQSHGGNDHPDNLQLLCGACNSKKGG